MAIGNVQQSRTMYLSHCLIGPRCWAWELPAWRPRRALNHTDAAYSTPSCSDRERVQVQRDMEQRLRQLVLRTLPPSQTLQIGVLDIDQAGRFEPFRSGTGADVCTLRDVVPLRIRLHCGEAMLSDWFERRMGPQKILSELPQNR